MMTEELKRSQESHLQKVLELAKEVSRTHTQTSIQELYYALRDVTYGLGATIKGLQDLQKLYGRGDLSYSLKEFSETLTDYYSIARTTSVEVLDTIRAIVEHELGVQKASK
ncbi:MAG: hypothetical protein SOW36_00160 [Porphyromonas sp.]|uniref:hypothetical protein n=1 Tax=Porphyromonas sp. TaxID=1924944 RepID=UPI002A7616A9|nr:hypothetical protein [Porphyromonas sp.]MDY3111044.1 hypothetical protein [Porphyromonas sp.]MDY4246255.1 hypothetical protein [Porphyromonas sp.]